MAPTSADGWFDRTWESSSACWILSSMPVSSQLLRKGSLLQLARLFGCLLLFDAGEGHARDQGAEQNVG